jgi:hypothetical protein
MAISCQVLLLCYQVSSGYCERALVNESGMMVTQMGTHNRLDSVVVPGTPCTIPPRNSNSAKHQMKTIVNDY